MNGVIEAAVLVVGILVGMVANYWAWSWIFAVRRKTRVRRLARPDDSPSEGSGIQQQSEEMGIGPPR